MTEPTRRQLQVLRLIAKRLSSGRPASRRELMSALGIKPGSYNAISDHLFALKRQGLVSWEEGKSRALRVTTAGKVLLKNGKRARQFIPVNRCSLCGASRVGEGPCPMCAPGDARPELEVRDYG